MKFTAKKIAEILAGKIVGNPETEVQSLAKIEEGKKGDLCFLSNKTYTPFIYKTKASVVIVNKDFKAENEISSTLIFVEDAYHSFSKLLEIFPDIKPDEIIQGLEKDSSFTFDVNGTKISLDANDFIIEFDVQEGFTFSRRNNLIGIISTERNEELMARGLIKDLARRLQALRKERGYNPTDVLNTASILDLDQESLAMLKDKTDELTFLVRVKQVNFTQTCKKYNDDDIDGQKIRISVE